MFNYKKTSLADFFIDFLEYVVNDPRNKGRDIDLQILRFINDLKKSKQKGEDYYGKARITSSKNLYPEIR